MYDITLQSAACDAGTWANASVHKCIFDPATTSTGGDPLFGLLVGGVVILSYFIASGGDLATPSVLTIIFGGILAQVLPGGLVGVAWAIAFVGLVGAIVAVSQRYVLSPGTR